MKATEQLATEVGIAPACRALSVPRSIFYRRNNSEQAQPKSHQPSPRALSPKERETVLKELTSPRFMDQSPRGMNTELLDEGTYLCSVSTMYKDIERQLFASGKA